MEGSKEGRKEGRKEEREKEQRNLISKQLMNRANKILY